MSASDDQELLVLRNDNFVQTHKRSFKKFLQNEDLSDVTLACQGQFVKAHRLVLAASSSFFTNMFNLCGSKDPIVVLNDVSVYHMKAILQYMYTGECQVQQDEVMTFLRVADSLLVHGLHDKDKDTRETSSSAGKSSSVVVEESSVATCVEESSVATSHEEVQQHEALMEEVIIKQEECDDAYLQFETIMEPEMIMNTTALHNPLNKQATSNHETEMHETAMQSSGDLFTIPAAVPSTSTLDRIDLADAELVLLDDVEMGKILDTSAETVPQRGLLRSAAKRMRMSTNQSRGGSTKQVELSRSKGDGQQPSTSSHHHSDLPSTSTDDDHASQGGVVCQVCKKRFRDNWFLKRHYKCVHESSSDGVLCPVCNKTFKNDVSLKVHVRNSHAGVRLTIPLKCDQCEEDVTFTSHAQLRQHVYRVHEFVDKHVCHVCDTLCKSRNSLHNHMKRYH